jgi:AraC-like DNA-binding protein
MYRVVKGDIDNSLKGSATVESFGAVRHYFSGEDGSECVFFIKHIHVSVGQYVSEGTLIAEAEDEYGNDFSLYNIFFDFENDDESGNATYGCVFLSNYDERLCTKKIEFKDVPPLNESGVFRGVDAAVRIFERLLHTDSRNPYYTFNASAQIISILGELLFSDSQNNSKGARLADRIVSYVYSNYDKSITPGKIASAFSYHQNYLNKLIKERFGKSLCEFIRAVKIEHAIALISENNSIPADIFQTLGYYDYSHFYKAFQKEIGLSPSEYVREHQ